ncbi:MAG: phosphatidylglycerophosphatase A [Desulfovibrio sp.]|nr:phosphatidylglycerophosphatase A [Desulfovibrio sp.]
MQGHNIKDELTLSFCRLGVAGLAPRAPGTWGTAVGCLLAPFLFFPLDIVWRVIVLIAIFIAGGLAATRAEKILRQKDPGEVVIDELAGVWLVFLPFPEPSFWLILSGFIFFRIFDIFKPWPVNASENWLPDGFGVMIDDIVAGVYALICMEILHWLGLF